MKAKPKIELIIQTLCTRKILNALDISHSGPEGNKVQKSGFQTESRINGHYFAVHKGISFSVKSMEQIEGRPDSEPVFPAGEIPGNSQTQCRDCNFNRTKRNGITSLGEYRFKFRGIVRPSVKGACNITGKKSQIPVFYPIPKTGIQPKAPGIGEIPRLSVNDLQTSAQGQTGKAVYFSSVGKINRVIRGGKTAYTAVIYLAVINQKTGIRNIIHRKANP